MTLNEACEIAARLWCELQYANKAMDVDSAESTCFSGSWKEMARQYLRDEICYRGLVVKIGELFGQEAKTSADGIVQQDVICAKVPELVERLFNEVRPDLVFEKKSPLAENPAHPLER